MYKYLIFIPLLLAFPAFAYDPEVAGHKFGECLVRQAAGHAEYGGTQLVQACQKQYRDFIYYCGGGDQCEQAVAQGVYTVLVMRQRGQIHE